MKRINYDQNGFTVTEFIIILVIVSLLVIFFIVRGVQIYTHEPIKSREAEVRSNLHVIQTALERYAVDNGGVYPLILYGGDWTDSFTTSRSPNYIDSSGKEQVGVSEYPGDVDVLLEFGYLPEYPSNPFVTPHKPGTFSQLCTPSKYNLPMLEKRVNIWADIPIPVHGNPDRSRQLIDRRVGGEKGNLMWDVSEGQRHSPFPIIVIPEPDPNVPDNYYHYVNPTEPANVEQYSYSNDHLFCQLQGNFYYYAIFSEAGGYTAFEKENPSIPKKMEPIGYLLAGYGAISNPWNDVYNIFGDFPDRSLGTENNPQALKEIDNIQSIDKIYVGPDGRGDGVITALMGGKPLADSERDQSDKFQDK